MLMIMLKFSEECFVIDLKWPLGAGFKQLQFVIKLLFTHGSRFYESG
jgi:hypothetical protein